MRNRASRIATWTSAIVVAACAACRDSATAPVVTCTEIAMAGIVVEVTSAATGGPLGDGSVMTLRDGSYSETVDLVSGNALLGAWERPGTYDVSVARAGFDTWTRNGVVVEESDDGCHVVQVVLQAALQPASGS